MEDRRRRALTRERGSALIVVLLAIVVLLPMTIVLSALVFRWQRQALDFRDVMSAEFVAQAGFEEARNRVAGDGLGLGPNQASSYELEDVGGVTASTRIGREPDLVLTLDGRILDEVAAGRADLEATGTDAEGRTVHRFRKVEIYGVRVEVSRRPTLPAVRLDGVLAKLPDGTVQTLGVSLRRGFR